MSSSSAEAPSSSTRLSHLLPVQLVANARALSLEQFTGSCSERYFLLVRLDDAGQRHEALRLLQQARSAAEQALATGAQTQTQLVELAEPANDANDWFTPDELRRRLAGQDHYAISLEARNDSATPGRISIGRSRQSDIVLADHSVSKLHAWFTRDAGGSYSVSDAGSRNGTRLNQLQLTAEQPVRVTAGDVLRFGSVEALLCPPTTLWRAAQDAEDE